LSDIVDLIVVIVIVVGGLAGAVGLVYSIVEIFGYNLRPSGAFDLRGLMSIVWISGAALCAVVVIPAWRRLHRPRNGPAATRPRRRR
jgi:uncharacterized membrane protein YciS (DUF1049 family)